MGTYLLTWPAASCSVEFIDSRRTDGLVPTMEMPYGGLKASGVGKEGPRSAVAEMTDAKTVVPQGRPW